MWHDLVDSSPDKMHVELDDLNVTLKACIGEVRRSIFALRPIVLDTLGFLPAVHQLLRSFGDLYSLSPQFEIAGPIERLDPTFELPLFRIIQESLNNVGQHATASSLSITLDLSATDAVKLTIIDNGIGFQYDEEYMPATSGHFGVQHMRERIESLAGTFSIESARGRGTHIQAVLPMNRR